MPHLKVNGANIYFECRKRVDVEEPAAVTAAIVDFLNSQTG